MQALYGYDVAADLQPELPLRPGGARPSAAPASSSPSPAEIGPALRRAFARGVPYLVNVVTDPEIAYPRSTTGV